MPSRSPSEASADPPPPYSACAPSGLPPGPPACDKRPSALEEPPPPYSACYVAFANPKEGIPSVHFYNGQGQSLGEESQQSINEPKRQNTIDKSDGCDSVTVSAVNLSRDGRDETIYIDSVPSTSGATGEGTHIVNIG